MSEPGQEEVQEGEMKRPAVPILPPLQRVPRPPMSAPGRGPPPRPPGGFGGSPSAEALAKAQEAIAKLSTQDLTPKETCVRTCAQPGMQGKDQGASNCVRMCVKMFRAVTYHVAKKFL